MKLPRLRQRLPAALFTTLWAALGTSFAPNAIAKPARTPPAHTAKASPSKAASVAPGFLGSNGLPRVGMRLVFDSGSQTFQGTATARRDANGRPVDQYGNPVLANPLENQAGVGFTTVDIVQSSPSLVAADMSQFLRMGPNLSQIFRMGAQAVQGNGQKLSDYWDNPAVLAQVPVGTHGQVTVLRGHLSVLGHALNTISFRLTNAVGTDTSIYDRGSGVLLLANSDHRANPLATNVAPEQDARVTTYIRLVGVRKLGYPWVGATPPASLTPGRKFSYQGGTQMVFPNVPPMAPSRYNTVLTVSKRVGLCVLAQETLSMSVGTSATTSRAYGSGLADALWIPPSAFEALHPGQVVDQDPITGYQVTFVGAKDKTATFQEQNATERNVRVYSTQSGFLLGFRSDTQHQNSVQTIIQQLVGQG